MRRTDPVDDAPDDDLGGLFDLVEGLGGRLKFEDDKEPLRVPDFEDDEVANSKFSRRIHADAVARGKGG